MVSISFCCKETGATSVNVRRRLGFLEDGGDVLAVVPLSFVGVRDELSESGSSSITSITCFGSGASDLGDRFLLGSAPGTSMLDCRIVVGDTMGVLKSSGLADLGANCWSNTFSPVMTGGPVSGPNVKSPSALGRLPAPTS
jgi:hypothetical protein